MTWFSLRSFVALCVITLYAFRARRTWRTRSSRWPTVSSNAFLTVKAWETKCALRAWSSVVSRISTNSQRVYSAISRQSLGSIVSARTARSWRAPATGGTMRTEGALASVAAWYSRLSKQPIETRFSRCTWPAWESWCSGFTPDSLGSDGSGVSYQATFTPATGRSQGTELSWGSLGARRTGKPRVAHASFFTFA